MDADSGPVLRRELRDTIAELELHRSARIKARATLDRIAFLARDPAHEHDSVFARLAKIRELARQESAALDALGA